MMPKPVTLQTHGPLRAMLGVLCLPAGPHLHSSLSCLLQDGVQRQTEQPPPPGSAQRHWPSCCRLSSGEGTASPAGPEESLPLRVRARAGHQADHFPTGYLKVRVPEMRTRGAVEVASETVGLPVLGPALLTRPCRWRRLRSLWMLLVCALRAWEGCVHAEHHLVPQHSVGSLDATLTLYGVLGVPRHDVESAGGCPQATQCPALHQRRSILGCRRPRGSWTVSRDPEGRQCASSHDPLEGLGDLLVEAGLFPSTILWHSSENHMGSQGLTRAHQGCDG